MRNTDPSREELFALVWERPATEVARELGISDVALGKLCRRLQVPKPPRGYWARVASGKTPRKPPLPAFRKEVEERGVAPSIRRLNKLNVVPTKELYQLFPGGPAKKAARIAGLQKPQGCV